MKLPILAVSMLFFVGAVAAANATTVDFAGAGAQNGGLWVEDGLAFDDIRIVNGGCDAVSGKPCGAFNDNETSVLTKVGGGTFTIASFWYQLIGEGTGGKKGVTNTFTLLSDLGGMLSFAANVVGSNDGGQVVDLTSLAQFQNVTSLTFITNNAGNARLDDLVVYTPSTVPVPAAGLMLLGALGTLVAVRRRQQA